MGFKIKNSLTGEFEKLPILTLKGEKGETGGVEEYNKVDYMGNKYETLKQANDANVEYAVKTAIGEFNYLDYDGQHITATDTIEGQAKSAILKGNTLVNVVGEKYRDCNLPTRQYVTAYGMDNTYNSDSYRIKQIDLKYPLTPNKEYLVMVDVQSMESCSTLMAYVYDGINTDYIASLRPNKIGLNVVKFTPTTATTRIAYYVNGNTEEKVVFGQPMIIEYQEGMENWNIPYFESMQSVKMPVLTTTGKNLFNPKWLKNTETESVLRFEDDGSVTLNGSLNSLTWFYLDLPKGTYQASSFNDTLNAFHVFWTGTDGFFETRNYFTLNEDTRIKGYITKGNYDNYNIKLQLETGTQKTSYEPFKSNILTVNGDVELRGIGDVRDELNCLTGEVTEHIGEVVLDGSESGWGTSGISNQSETVVFQFNTNSNKTIPHPEPSSLPITNQLPSNNNSANDSEGFLKCQGTDGHGFYIRIKRSRLETEDVSGFKKWLNQNPIKICYPVANKSIKTVDLSNNHVYSYKDVTHYDCSSAEGSLVPTLSVKVPTDVQATIAQQRETIQTLNSENERLNQIQEALKASMLDSQVQLMNLSWDTDFEVFTLRESIAPKDFLLASRTGSNIDKFSQAKFIIENDCPDLEKLNSQIEYYFSKDVFSQEQFEELTDLISIVKGENGCEY